MAATLNDYLRVGPLVDTPGWAEIKSHRSISAGWRQLSRSGRGAPRLPRFLLTYEPLRNGSPQWQGRVDAIRVRAAPYTPGAAAPRPGERGRWLDLGDVTLKPDEVGRRVLSRENLSAFGIIMESFVKERFWQRARRRGPRDPLTTLMGGQGPDVQWKEIADFYRELALETGDAFMAELAQEIAA